MVAPPQIGTLLSDMLRTTDHTNNILLATTFRTALNKNFAWPATL